MRRVRPEQAIAADAWRRAASMLAQFGMTPAARPKVEAMPPAEPDALAVFRAAHPRGTALDQLPHRLRWQRLLQ